MVFGRLFKTTRRDAGNAASLYGAIVAQARSPAFYAVLGVPDSIEGRFEMVVLHTVLVVRRLRGEGGTEAQELGQEIFDYFCLDMDRTLREMGIGDLSVPKKMRAVGEAFYGRANAYEPCLAAGDADGLAAAFVRNILSEGPGASNAPHLAAYALAVAGALAKMQDADLMAARLALPDPETYAGGRP